MEVKPGYKQTEVGVIPEDWEVKPLSDFFSISVGRDLKEENYSTFQDAVFKYPVFSNTVSNEGLYGFYDFPEYNGESLTIVGRGGGLGTAFKRNHGFGAIGRLLVLFPKENVNAAFVTEYINHRVKIFTESGGIPQLTGISIAKYRIPLPPTLAEQKAIAEALSDADALIESLEQLIAKKRQIKQGAMQELLTGKKRLPGFSGEWSSKKISDLAVLSKAGINPAVMPADHFTHFSLPAFDAGATPMIEKGDRIGSNKFIVPRSAVLVSKLNPRIPRVWTPSDIPDNAVCSTEFLVLLPHEDIDRNYFAALCLSPDFCYQMELQATGTTGSHQRIHPSQALAIEVRTPNDKTEQTAIAAILNDMDAEIAALEAKLAKARQLKQGMMQELLTGRIRLK